jgi:hypothetical protein
MQPSDVTLSERARKLSTQFGISESALRQARCSSISTLEGREYFIVIGTLSDGRTVRMNCGYAQRNHIVSFRPIS